MRRLLVLVAVCFACLTTIVPSPALAAAPSPEQVQAVSFRIVELINQRRAEAGLQPVNIHSVLTPCAQQYSEVIASQGKLIHTGPDGSSPGDRLTRCGYRWRVYGENLAAGFSDPDRLVQAWMNSPSHRNVLLNPKVVDIGLGHAYRENDPSRYYDYWAMEVGISR